MLLLSTIVYNFGFQQDFFATKSPKGKKNQLLNGETTEANRRK